jgi:hypothetical protein
MSRKVLLISGYIASGKDTIADFLVANKGYIKMSFADELKRLTSIKYSFNPELCYSHTGKESPYVTNTGKLVTIRDLLIKEGKAGREINENIWAGFLIDKIIKTTPEDAKIAIADFRYPVEYESVKDAFPGTKTLRISRENAGSRGIESENSLDDFKFDFNINNDDSLEILYYKLRYSVTFF